MESKNNRAKVTGIAFRKIVEEQVLEEAIRRMSMQQEYINDREWLEALRKVVKDEEDLQERRKLKGNSFGTVAQKRKAPNMQRQRLRNQSIPPKKKGYTRQQKRRQLRPKRKQQRPERISYTRYGRRHTRELTRKKLMNAKQRVNVRGVHSTTTDGNTARKKSRLVRPD